MAVDSEESGFGLDDGPYMELDAVMLDEEPDDMSDDEPPTAHKTQQKEPKKKGQKAVDKEKKAAALLFIKNVLTRDPSVTVDTGLGKRPRTSLEGKMPLRVTSSDLWCAVQDDPEARQQLIYAVYFDSVQKPSRPIRSRR